MRVEQWAGKWFERGEITQEEVDWVKTVSPKPGYIYANIKTHNKGWPYRFIMSANEKKRKGLRPLQTKKWTQNVEAGNIIM